MSDKLIEKIYADKFDTDLTSRKDIGDIYVNKIPINIKSSRVGGNNFSPNLVSADKLYNHLIDEKNNLKFLFVKYENKDGNILISEEKLVDVEHISWDCLEIRCQGKGAIQLSGTLKIDKSQTREKFLTGLCNAYKVYIEKERKKLNKLEQKYVRT